MIQTVIQNNKNEAAAFVDLPQTRMNLAGVLAALFIQQPPYVIQCSDNDEDDIQVKFVANNRFEAQIIAAVKDTDSLSAVNTACEMFCSLPYDRQQELKAEIEENGIGSLRAFVDQIAHPGQSESMVSYYCPLTADYFERDRWGEIIDDPIELDGEDLSRYEENIRAALKREQEGADMAEYFSGSNTAVSKLRSAVWDIENIDGVLYGRITVHLTEPFTADEEAEFLGFTLGQNSDGLGEGFEQRPIRDDDGELYVHLWTSDDSYFICREDELDEYINNNHYGMEMR